MITVLIGLNVKAKIAKMTIMAAPALEFSIVKCFKGYNDCNGRNLI